MKTATRLLAVLGVLISLISLGVNFLIDGQFSWALLVVGFIVIAAAATITARKAPRRKTLYTAVTVSVLLIPYVLIGEFVLYSQMAVLDLWRGSLTVVAAFWILAFWAVVLLAMRGKNPFYALGLTFIVVAVGLVLTRTLLLTPPGVWYVITRFSGLILAGALSFVIGKRYRKGEKNDQKPLASSEK